MEDKYSMQPGQEHEPNQSDAEDVDALLQDVKSLLGESDGEAAEQPSAEDEPAPEESGGEPLSAEDVHIDYGKFYGPEEQKEPEAPLTFYEQSKPAYQRARRAEYERVREQERLARAERQQAFEQERAAHMKKKKAERKHAGTHKSTAEYAEWLYTQGLSDDEHSARAEQEKKLAQPETRRRGKPEKPKRRHGLRIVLLLILLLALGAASFHFLIARAPQSENALSARKSGCATILVAGTDEGGYRTDSMMLVNVNRTEKTIHLVSIPRDTLVYCEYSVPKLNSAYGWAGGGDDGMQELLTRVEEIVGFRPDGYVVTDLACFEELVDLMGGVTFDVPVEMHYNDPSQNLYIDLSAGEQKLDGAQAMQVMRFRSGYADADLGRVKVQRDFLAAALHQWASVKNAYKLPSAIRLITEHTKTDLTSAQLAWLAESAALCGTDGLTMATMPGSAAWIGGGSYYVLDAAQVADLVNEKLNPYQKEVTAMDLAIRAG